MKTHIKMIQRMMNKIQRTSKEKPMCRVQLTYTDQMKEQDIAWNIAEENLELMIRLHETILNEARTLGWNGYAITYTYEYPNDSETVTEIYTSERDWIDGKEPLEIVAPCRLLIKELEDLLNEQRKKETDSILIAKCLQEHRKISVMNRDQNVKFQCDLYYDGCFYEVKDRTPDFSKGISLEEIKRLGINDQQIS